MDSGGSGNDFVMYHLLFSNVFANNPVFEKSGIYRMAEARDHMVYGLVSRNTYRIE